MILPFLKYSWASCSGDRTSNVSYSMSLESFRLGEPFEICFAIPDPKHLVPLTPQTQIRDLFHSSCSTIDIPHEQYSLLQERTDLLLQRPQHEAPSVTFRATRENIRRILEQRRSLHPWRRRREYPAVSLQHTSMHSSLVQRPVQVRAYSR